MNIFAILGNISWGHMSKVTSQNTNFQIQNQQNQRETDLTQDKTQIWKASRFVRLGLWRASLDKIIYLPNLGFALEMMILLWYCWLCVCETDFWSLKIEFCLADSKCCLGICPKTKTKTKLKAKTKIWCKHKQTTCFWLWLWVWFCLGPK